MVNNGSEKSIWDDLPDAWINDIDYKKDKGEQTDTRQEEKIEQNTDVETSDEPTSISEDNIKKDGIKEDIIKEDGIKEDILIRKQEKDFLKEIKENQSKSSKKVKEAYEKEKKGNRKDFLIVGIIVSLIILFVVVLLMIFSVSSNQKIYKMIDSGRYGTAYQEITQLYENDKNVDEVIVVFVESCVNHSEYKRAIAALEMLSDNALSDIQFFEELLDTLIIHQKEKRAKDVIQFLYNRGFDAVAYELYQKYYNVL